MSEPMKPKSTEAISKVQSSLSKLLGHFEARADDAPDVREYKESMREVGTRLSSDMRALDGLAEGE